MKANKKLTFAERLARRNRILAAVLVLMTAYMSIVGELGLGDSRMMSPLAEKVSRIIFFGGMVWVAVQIGLNRKLMKNSELRKEKMLEENDERNRAIHEKSGGTVWDIVLICQLFITLTASLTDMAAFTASMITLCILLAAKAGSLLLLRKNGV